MSYDKHVPSEPHYHLTAPQLRPPDTHFLFLSLYLILFAFFIYLVAISTMESKKVREGLKSVNSTFSGEGKAQEKPSGKLMRGYKNGGKFDQKIQGVFQNLMPDQDFKKRGRGESIEIIIPPKKIFNAQKRDQISERGLVLLSSIVRTMREPVGGKAVELAVLISRQSKGVMREEGRFYGERDNTLMMGVIARTMSKFGVNQNNFSVGFHEEGPDQMIFKFRRAVVE